MFITIRGIGYVRIPFGFRSGSVRVLFGFDFVDTEGVVIFCPVWVCFFRFFNRRAAEGTPTTGLFDRIYMINKIFLCPV